MKKLSHVATIVLLAALVSSCGSRSGTTGPGPGTVARVTPVPSARGVGSGASPTSAVPQAVVDEHWPREETQGSEASEMIRPPMGRRAA